MTSYNTNLASEFYVLSILHRLGQMQPWHLVTRRPWTSSFIVYHGACSVVSRKLVNEKSRKYLHAWSLIDGEGGESSSRESKCRNKSKERY